MIRVYGHASFACEPVMKASKRLNDGQALLFNLCVAPLRIRESAGAVRDRLQVSVRVLAVGREGGRLQQSGAQAVIGSVYLHDDGGLHVKKTRARGLCDKLLGRFERLLVAGRPHEGGVRASELSQEGCRVALRPRQKALK